MRPDKRLDDIITKQEEVEVPPIPIEVVRKTPIMTN